jgi:hypothetical protein
MTQEEIIELAMNSGLPSKQAAQQQLWWLVSFAKLVAAKEREACAKEAEDSDHVVLGRSYHDQLGNAGATAKNIAVAIREKHLWRVCKR